MSETADIRRDFLDRSAAMAQGEGLSPICGRVFGLLVFDGGPVSFSELAERVDVSRASISTATRVLEERGLIRRFRQAGQRGDMFDISHPPYHGLLSGVIRRARQAGADVEATREALPTDDTERLARLASLSTFYETMQSCAETALNRLTEEAPE